MIELDGFRNSAGHGFHVSSGESSISVKTLVKHNHIPGLLKEIPIIERQESPDIHHEILFSRHGATIGVGAKFMKNLGDSLVLIALFSSLDEVGVLDRARGIEHHLDSVL